VQHGLAIEDHDQEGRVITAEFPHFYLTNVYTPNSGAHASPLCADSITCRRHANYSFCICMRCRTSWRSLPTMLWIPRRGWAAAAGVQDAALGHGLRGACAAAAAAEARHHHRRLQLRAQGAHSRARGRCAA
jgi:hypothetical protein